MLFFNSARNRYYFSFRDPITGARKQLSCKTSNRDLAELYVRSLQPEPPTLDAAPPATCSQYLSQFIVEYGEFIRGLNYTDPAIKSNISALKLLLRRVGDQPLNEISIEMCEKFIATNQPTLETAAKYYGHLKAAFRRAKKWKRIDTNPFDEITKPKPREKLPDVFTLEEYEALLDSLPTNTHEERRLKRIVTVARDSGLRMSEILTLRKASLDFDRKLILIVVTEDFSPKSKRPRAVVMSKRVESILLEQMAENVELSECIARSDYIFPSRSGQPLSKITVSHSFKQHVKRLYPNRPRLRFHSLRHTFASLLVERNVPLVRIQKLMGHSTIAMTEKYARLRSDDFSEARRAIDSL